MGQVFCPRCKKKTFPVNQIYTPFPKSLRLVRRDTICIYCGAMLSRNGGKYTEFGKLIVLIALICTVGLVIISLQHLKQKMPLAYILTVMIEELIIYELVILIFKKFINKRKPRNRP